MQNQQRKQKHNFRRHSAEITTSTQKDIPTEIYVDTNYKHYNTTIRRTENGIQIRTLESPKKKQKPLLPEKNYKPEPFKIEPLETIKEIKLQPLPPIPPQLITPPPAYQCLGNNTSVPIPIPSAPNIEQPNT